ncbi:NfeD family protein [Aquisalimonas sp.]|uniref:NfeD family protein n=1 Tax=Aquisalimonas sp. TaxID=1872621 RepID=UPI0025BE1D38|nr:NfeD family protein [Aquisalimonas sp.]
MDIPPHLLWLAAALLLGAMAPVLGGHLFVVDLALSALLLSILTALFPEMPFFMQLAVFLGASALMIPVYSWVAARMTQARRAGLIGSTAEYRGNTGIVERRGSGVGVRVGGDVFPARALDDGPLEPGQRVTIERFEGITAVVRRIR